MVIRLQIISPESGETLETILTQRPLSLSMAQGSGSEHFMAFKHTLSDIRVEMSSTTSTGARPQAINYAQALAQHLIAEIQSKTNEPVSSAYFGPTLTVLQCSIALKSGTVFTIEQTAQSVLGLIHVVGLRLESEPRYVFARQFLARLANSNVHFYAIVKDNQSAKLLCENNRCGFTSYPRNVSYLHAGLIPRDEELIRG